MESYGIYTLLDKSSEELPQILEFTRKIPVSESIEFGVILKIKGHRGGVIDFTIEHPRWIENGKVMPDFRAQLPIKSNDFRAFLGDTFWQPLENKVGKWTIRARFEGKQFLNESFEMYLP